MPLSFATHHVESLGVAGAGRLFATPDAEATAVVACLGTSAVTDPDAPPLDTTVVALRWDQRYWRGTVYGAALATRCSWFARVGGVWQAGPVDTIVLPHLVQVAVDNPADWVVARLQEIEAANPPLSDRPLPFERAYPRNVSSWPVASVQLDDFSRTAGLVGDAQSVNANRSIVRGSVFAASVGITCWCETPEMRSRLTPWFVGILETLRWLSRAEFGHAEPVVNISEAEDFESLKVPAFQIIGRLSVQMPAGIVIPPPPTFGPLTVLP